MDRERELMLRIKERMWQRKIKEMVERDEARREFTDYLTPYRERIKRGDYLPKEG